MNVRQYTAFISSNNDKPNYGIMYGDMSKDDFSENLFWDADPDDLDLARNRRYVVQRVLGPCEEQALCRTASPGARHRSRHRQDHPHVRDAGCRGDGEIATCA